jgi:uncharacterized protein YjiS (DUF1127 family)
MASITTFDGSFRGEGIFARVRRAFDDYRLYRATINELEALNSRELRDLGISRLSIREIARDSVYGA